MANWGLRTEHRLLATSQEASRLTGAVVHTPSAGARRAVMIGTRQLGVLALLAVLLLPLLGRPAALAVAPHAQPELLALAGQQSAAHVRVIVQKTTPDVGVEVLVTRLGGTVTKDLSIIHAFAADIPASAVATLASAHGVRWLSRDGLVVNTATTCTSCISTTNLKNAYVSAVGADKLWNVSPYLQGQGIGVAVVDSGITSSPDFGGTTKPRITGFTKTNAATNSASDAFGHGTHVAGIIGGGGAQSSGAYIGIAPNVNLLNVKVSDDQGLATESDVVAGLQWVNTNRTSYNIRVVNLSLNSSTNQSYNVDPMDAAVEVLWFNSVVVVVSAGNSGPGALYPPANDPFAITVGAVDDKGTLATTDDTLVSFSAYGTTGDGFSKPDVVAPGKNIISTLAGLGATLPMQHPANVVSTNNQYFRMSGTSMAAPIVSGITALLLQKSPTLTPDQVKYRLKATAHAWGTGTGAGYVDAYAAANGTTTASANTGVVESKLLWQNGVATTWNSASWGSASWGSASWGSASWGSASWGSDYWGQ